MPTEYTEDADDEFDYAADWKELLDPAADDNVSNAVMEATLTGVVPFNKIRSCARWFLGYSECDDGSPYGLYREPPAFHPRWPNLYAHGVSFKGLNPQSNADNPNGEPYTESPFDPDLYTSKFEKALVTVRFRSFGRMRFLGDDDIASSDLEWQRWTQFTTSPQIEALSSDGASQLKFAEGGPPPTGVAFPAPVATLLAKCNFVASWLHVPHRYLSESDLILKPTKILNCVGRVNDDTAFGEFDAGTLLLQPPTFEPVLFPVVAEKAYDLMTGWNVHLPFVFFDPEKGVPGSSYRGHNLMPWRSDGKFYLATRDGTTTGRRLLAEADFGQIFTHVSAP